MGMHVPGLSARGGEPLDNHRSSRSGTTGSKEI